MQQKRSRCPNGTRKNNKGECKPFNKTKKLNLNKEESIEKPEIIEKLKSSPSINKSTLKQTNKKMDLSFTLLRQFATPQNLSLRNGVGLGGAARDGRNLSYLNHQPQRRRNDSPPRATFRVVSDNGYAQISSAYLR